MFLYCCHYLYIFLAQIPAPTTKPTGNTHNNLCTISHCVQCDKRCLYLNPTIMNLIFVTY